MKKYLNMPALTVTAFLSVYAFCSAVSPAFAEEDIIRNIEKRDGKLYKPGADRPYTGSYQVSNEETGVSVEIHIKDGALDGDYIERYANGRKKMQSQWKNGVQDGLLTYWDEDEHKLIESEMQNGLPHGMETMWNIDGTKIAETPYKNGKLAPFSSPAVPWKPAR